MSKHFVSGKDESVRMFKSDFMESLSKVHPSVPLFIFLPVILFFFYRSVFTFGISYLLISLFILMGLFVWTLTEYVLHRFVFHYPLKGKFGERIHFIFHGVHHDYPQDSRRLVMPPSISIPLATGFYFLFRAILGQVTVSPFFIGFIAGYLVYDIGHYALHHLTFKNKLMMNLKQHHMRHHYQDPSNGFGVSSLLWDYFFQTTFQKK